MSVPVEGPCPICDSQLQQIIPINAGLELHCDVCGKYQISEELFDDGITPPVPKDRRYLISAWLRHRNYPDHVIEFLMRQELQLVYQNSRDYSVSQKQDLYLQAIGDRSDFPGSNVSLSANNDYPLAYARFPEELQYYHAALHERGLIVGRLSDVKVTPGGWDRISALAATSITSDQAFIAMWLDPQMDSAWENGILPAVEDAGFTPMRVDREPHIERIDAKIVSEIKASRFLVADVTGQRQGVYFEAGYALGLGLPVFWSCREDELDIVHFDTRQFNHVVWNDPESLRNQLESLIKAII